MATSQVRTDIQQFIPQPAHQEFLVIFDPILNPFCIISGPRLRLQGQLGLGHNNRGAGENAPSRSSPPWSQTLSTAPSLPPRAPASPRTTASSNRSIAHGSPARLPAGPGSRWPATPNVASDRSGSGPCPARTRLRAAIPDRWTAGCSRRSHSKAMVSALQVPHGSSDCSPPDPGSWGPMSQRTRGDILGIFRSLSVHTTLPTDAPPWLPERQQKEADFNILCGGRLLTHSLLSQRTPSGLRPQPTTVMLDGSVTKIAREQGTGSREPEGMGSKEQGAGCRAWEPGAGEAKGQGAGGP